MTTPAESVAIVADITDAPILARVSAASTRGIRVATVESVCAQTVALPGLLADVTAGAQIYEHRTRRVLWTGLNTFINIRILPEVFE